MTLWLAPMTAQEIVHFRSADDNGPKQESTEHGGRLFRPNGDGPIPASVELPGRSGVISSG